MGSCPTELPMRYTGVFTGKYYTLNGHWFYPFVLSSEISQTCQAATTQLKIQVKAQIQVDVEYDNCSTQKEVESLFFK